MTDHPDRPVETPRQWLRFAAGDLAVAQHEMQQPTPVYHTVCFLCQSAAEKSLKGFLIAQGWPLEKTHDLVALLGSCTDYDTAFEVLLAEGAVLNEYIVAGRYPGDLGAEQIGASQASEALAAAEKIHDRVLVAMKNSGSAA